VDAAVVDDRDVRDAYSPRSLAVYTAAARSFLTELAIAGPAAHLDLDRMRRLLRRRVPKTEYPHVDPSALIPQVVAYYDQQQLPATGAARLILLRNRALLHTLDATGMRAAECVALRRSQLASGQDEARVRGKGRKTRAIFFAEEARAAIAAYLAERHDDHPYLYISHGRGPARAAQEAETVRRHAPLTTAQVYHIVRTAALAVGAPEVHPHTLRHHRASRWLTDGMPLEMVQELLGHASIVVTRTVYAHYLGSAVRDAYFAHAVREARDRAAAP
jgi:site-specific recombinase XerD